MKKRVVAIVMAALVLLSSCGGDRYVVDAGGIGRERDAMIAEAVENTRAMDQEP